jgi:hypothetical protein
MTAIYSRSTVKQLQLSSTSLSLNGLINPMCFFIYKRLHVVNERTLTKELLSWKMSQSLLTRQEPNRVSNYNY